jgi:hypothetical protein
VCLGTLTVMIVTALLIDGCYRWLLWQRIPAKAGLEQGGAHV